MPRLQRSFSQLPGDFPRRFSSYAELLYETIYEGVRAEVLPHRLTARGVRVARRDAGVTEAEDMDTYVSKTLRAIRNSSHGFLERLPRGPIGSGSQPTLATSRTRLLTFAALIGLGLVADAERLVARKWWDD